VKDWRIYHRYRCREAPFTYHTLDDRAGIATCLGCGVWRVVPDGSRQPPSDLAWSNRR
jgi:hypothetical protein